VNGERTRRQLRRDQGQIEQASTSLGPWTPGETEVEVVGVKSPVGDLGTRDPANGPELVSVKRGGSASRHFGRHPVRANPVGGAGTRWGPVAESRQLGRSHDIRRRELRDRAVPIPTPSTAKDRQAHVARVAGAK
jgi:hypothetical protein